MKDILVKYYGKFLIHENNLLMEINFNFAKINRHKMIQILNLSGKRLIELQDRKRNKQN